MLAQRGREDIHVYERLSAPAGSDDTSVWSDTAKFYLVGLGGRGQKALQELGAWERVERCCTYVLGRKDWAPGAGEDEGVERIFGDDRPYKTAVIARDRLAGVLREIVAESHRDAVTLHYDTEMTSVRWNEAGSPFIVTAECSAPTLPADGAAASAPGCEVPLLERSEVRCDLLVGADGAARTLASAMERDGASSAAGLSRWLADLSPLRPQALRVTRYEDDNRRVYKTIPMRLPPSKTWRGDVNYSARTKDGRVVFDALPANAEGEYCAVLLLQAEDEFAQPHSDPAGLRALLEDTLPQFSPLISDATVRAVAAKAPSNLPAFRFVGPVLHKGASTVLLGDAIHTVKPYFGLGVNSAFEDVVALRAALDAHPRDAARALSAFSDARAGEAAALVRISRDLDRPGLLGFVTFILPIILDGIFSSIAPQLFGPNTIALLQRDGITFQEVAQRKRRDRALQVATLVAVAWAASILASGALRALTPGLDAVPVSSGLGAILLAGVGAFQVARVWEPGMAPADVLAKTLQPVTDVISAEDRGSVSAQGEDAEDDDKDEPPPPPFFGKGGLPLL
jgi:2-polyprenyl-6-methoxyphenol hydroxylase-like FAD-dependent oxidoreductase